MTPNHAEPKASVKLQRPATQARAMRAAEAPKGFTSHFHASDARPGILCTPRQTTRGAGLATLCPSGADETSWRRRLLHLPPPVASVVVSPKCYSSRSHTPNRRPRVREEAHPALIGVRSGREGHFGARSFVRPLAALRLAGTSRAEAQLDGTSCHTLLAHCCALPCRPLLCAPVEACDE